MCIAGVAATNVVIAAIDVRQLSLIRRRRLENAAAAEAPYELDVRVQAMPA
jgi:hypothetical protein